MTEAMKTEALNDFINEAMKSKGGRILFSTLIQHSEALKPITSVDTNLTFYIEGKKEMGFFLIGLIKEADNSNFAKLLTSEE